MWKKDSYAFIPKGVGRRVIPKSTPNLPDPTEPFLDWKMLPAAVLIIDLEGTIIAVNQQAQLLLRWSPGASWPNFFSHLPKSFHKSLSNTLDLLCAHGRQTLYAQLWYGLPVQLDCISIPSGRKHRIAIVLRELSIALAILETLNAPAQEMGLLLARMTATTSLLESDTRSHPEIYERVKRVHQESVKLQALLEEARRALSIHAATDDEQLLFTNMQVAILEALRQSQKLLDQHSLHAQTHLPVNNIILFAERIQLTQFIARALWHAIQAAPENSALHIHCREQHRNGKRLVYLDIHNQGVLCALRKASNHDQHCVRHPKQRKDSAYISLWETAHRLGGTLKIQSIPYVGIRIFFRLPGEPGIRGGWEVPVGRCPTPRKGNDSP